MVHDLQVSFLHAFHDPHVSFPHAACVSSRHVARDFDDSFLRADRDPAVLLLRDAHDWTSLWNPVHDLPHVLHAAHFWQAYPHPFRAIHESLLAFPFQSYVFYRYG